MSRFPARPETPADSASSQITGRMIAAGAALLVFFSLASSGSHSIAVGFGLTIFIGIPISLAVASIETKSGAMERRRAARLRHLDEVKGGRVHYIGGNWPNLTLCEYYEISFDESGISIHDGHSALLKVPWSHTSTISVTGQGARQSGGGFIGGGFGAEGALTGMAIASVLNAATSRTTQETSLSITTSDGYAVFRFSEFAPEEVRRWIALGGAQVHCAPPDYQSITPECSPNDIASALKALAEMRNSGALTEEEYRRAKGRLLE